MELVQLKEVNKSFKKATILTDVNLSIEEGDLFGIIGSSGSGKTTLLNLITGFLEPTSGKISCSFVTTKDPMDLTKSLHKIKHAIGFAPQHNSFYPHLTVEENLTHFGKLYGLKKETLKNNVDSLLHATKLGPHRHKLAKHLSGGMQKRLDISCSLVHKPKMIVLDEPTADLDPILQREVMSFLTQINQLGVTVVVASHHLHLIENVCNKVAIIHNGKVHSHGHMEHVRKPYLRDTYKIKIRPGKDQQKWASYLERMNIGDVEQRSHSLVVKPYDTQHAVCQLLSLIEQENLSLYDLDLRKPSLGEIFEKIVRE